jgi:hypothetical protein
MVSFHVVALIDADCVDPSHHILIHLAHPSESCETICGDLERVPEGPQKDGFAARAVPGLISPGVRERDKVEIIIIE